MAEVWIGRLNLGAAMRSRRVRVRGPEHLVRSLPDWLGLNVFAHRTPQRSSPSDSDDASRDALPARSEAGAEVSVTGDPEDSDKAVTAELAPPI